MAPFSPALLLKLFIYGYQEGIRSSRRIETEMRRNQEVKWLCQNALPSYKTIADFRKNNAADDYESIILSQLGFRLFSLPQGQVIR